MTQRQHKHAMNLAIDRLLDDEARGALDAQLDKSPDDAQLWNRMQRVDRTLRAAQPICAPAGFSARLMAAISAGRQPQTDPLYGIGIALGLLAAALIGIPLLGGALFLMVRALSDMAVVQMLITRAIGLLHGLGDLLVGLIHSISVLVANNPLFPVLALSAIVMLSAWSWLTYSVAARYPPVTYRIPVRINAS